MKRLLLFTSAAVAALLAVAPARADLVSWTYNAQPVLPGGGPALQFDGPGGPGTGTGGVSFTNEPSASAVGSTDIVMTNTKTFSSATDSARDTFTTVGAYKLTLAVTDTATGQSHLFSWDGKLSGWATSGSSNLTNAFLSPMTQMWTTT